MICPNFAEPTHTRGREKTRLSLRIFTLILLRGRTNGPNLNFSSRGFREFFELYLRLTVLPLCCVFSMNFPTKKSPVSCNYPLPPQK